MKTAAADIFIGSLHGSEVHRRDLEDPQRPGHLREGLLLEPDAWAAARHFGLRSPSGKSLGFIEPSRDPREPTTAEAPEELRKVVETARAILDDVRKRIQRTLNERDGAEAEAARIEGTAWRRASAPGDPEVYHSALARRVAAIDQLSEFFSEERLAVKRLSDAEVVIRRWIWDERLKRYGRA